MSLRILDCTLRDGGYYNSWCFSRELVVDYLRAVARAGVDFVEIGFRGLPQAAFVGPYAYSTDAFLDRLPIPDELALGVMVDAKGLVATGDACRANVEKLFSDRRSSRVELVRIAAHFDEVVHCRPLVDELKALGYTVGLNIMQMAGRDPLRVSELAACVQAWSAVDVLYFADSLGSMDVEDVDGAYEALRQGWSGAIGIHAHNNKSLSIQNSLRAMRIGVEWLDATVLGMGRGAGNADLGILLGELVHEGLREADLVELYRVAEEHFQRLKDEYRWGPNLLYHLSALHDIHPMFAQALLADDRYSPEDRFAVIKSLANEEARSFDRSDMDRRLQPYDLLSAKNESTEPAEIETLSGASVLIVGAGSSARIYAEDLGLFVAQHRPLVLTLNHQEAIDLDLVDGIVCIDQRRLLYEADFLASCGKPIYTARRLLSAPIRDRLARADLRQYDCMLQPETFAAHAEGCVIPEPLAFGYALGLCISAKARRIFLVGLDGFEADDPRQQQMLHLLRIMEPWREGIEMIALTPTNYPIDQGSLYADYR